MTLKNQYVRFFLFISIISTAYTAHGMFPLNVFRPWDINLRPPRWHDRNLQITGYAETGFDAHAYNSHGKKVNTLEIWNENQDALAMFEGFPDNTAITDFLDNVLGNPLDDGVRGHLVFNGDFKMNASAGIALRYHVPHSFNVGLFLPFYDMQLNKITFTDLTPESDTVIRTELTDQFLARVQQFDATLDLSGWKRAGVGDLALLAEWWKDFPQGKQYLRNVNVEGRFGFTFPTGLKKNENQILSIPFGNDGSAGTLIGGGVNVMWSECVRAGIDAQFLILFGNTRTRRIKVDTTQTDFLLLAQAKVHKEYGIVQRFNLYAETYKLWYGLSLGAVYQYWKEGDDKLTLATNQYSNEIANSAASLEEWTMHQIIFTAKYDFQDVVADTSWLRPHIFAFYKLPINGSRALMASMVGVSLTLNF